MGMIDAHVHVFAKASAEFPREVSERLPVDREEPVEKLMGEMETCGVKQAVLVQIGGRELAQHAYLQHCLKTYPGRFKGIGLIPAGCENPADHMDRLAGDGEIIGFRLNRVGGPEDPLAPMDVRTFETYPIWKRAAEKDYVLWLYLRAVDAHTVPFLVDAFPNVRVVFNHLMVCPGKGKFSNDEFGRPRIETAMPPLTRYATLGLHQYERVHVLLSGQYAFSKEDWPYSDLAAWHARLVRSFGADRLMWATDFPWIVKEPGYGKLVRVLDELLPDLPAADRGKIMGGTAGRVLGFPEPAGT